MAVTYRTKVNCKAFAIPILTAKTIETRWNSMAVTYRTKVNCKAFAICILTARF